MAKKWYRGCAMTFAGGIVFGLFGVTDFSCLKVAVENLPGTLFSEFLTDNDAIWDVFQDDFGTGTTYNDRNTDNPTREEPDPAN